MTTSHSEQIYVHREIAKSKPYTKEEFDEFVESLAEMDVNAKEDGFTRTCPVCRHVMPLDATHRCRGMDQTRFPIQVSRWFNLALWASSVAVAVAFVWLVWPLLWWVIGL